MNLKTDDLIRDRYRLLRLLGRSAVNATWLARDERGGGSVVVKFLSLEKLENWKEHELFEREIKVLKNLHHPRLPAYRDDFFLEEEKCLGLVQDHLEGVTLDQAVADGRRFTEEEAVEFARRLLDILVYLGGLNPPVIHRDINPKNIILDPAGDPFLVDFDAVTGVFSGTGSGGDTVVGTFGYMPMEQILGRVTQAADLYALGVTLLFLLTHRRPEQFTLKKMKLDFRPHLHVSPGLADLIDRLIEPDVEKRLADARQALALLEDLGAGRTPVYAGTVEAAEDADGDEDALFTTDQINRRLKHVAESIRRRLADDGELEANLQHEDPDLAELLRILPGGRQFFLVRREAGAVPNVQIDVSMTSATEETAPDPDARIRRVISNEVNEGKAQRAALWTGIILGSILFTVILLALMKC